MGWRPATGLTKIHDMRPDRHIFHNVVAAIRHRVHRFFLICVAILFATSAGAQDRPDMEDLFRRLADPDGEGWRIAESDILREWSKSGSAAMDLLLQRGEEALDQGDAPAAIGHLTALTDHAPDFAAGFQARAAAYASVGQFGPALRDLARALQLEPRYFPALTQLAVMLEETGDTERALAAYRQSLEIHPNQQEAIDGVARLERQLDGTDI